MNTTFHNTIRLEGSELVSAANQAQAQKELILSFLKQNAGRKFTPRELHGYFPNMELTSVRRCLTDLTKEGFLMNTMATGEKREESKGRPNYLWYYPQPTQTKLSFL